MATQYILYSAGYQHSRMFAIRRLAKELEEIRNSGKKNIRNIQVDSILS